MTPRGKRTRKRLPDEREWLNSFHEALALVEDHILPREDEYDDDPLLQAAASDALNRIRTAASHLSHATLRAMPEVQAEAIADIRNLAVYEYPTHPHQLVFRTLKRHAEQWRDAIDRARGMTRDGQPLPPLPTRADGSLQRSRPSTLCGKPVKSAGHAPCLLDRGHGGNCRSRL